MMIKNLSLILSIVLFVACSGSKKTIQSEPIQDNVHKTGSLEDSNNFGFELFKIIPPDKENPFISPYSITEAMAMVYLGSNGQTAGEIQEVFQFGDNSPSFHRNRAELADKLQRDALEDSNILKVANALWIQSGFELNKNYVDHFHDYYGDKLHRANFTESSEREQARNGMNRWVSDVTNDKIEEAVPEGILTDRTRTVLINAIYFLGDWEHSFNPDKNSENNFYPHQGEPKKIEFMSQNKGFPFYANNEFQVLEMKYKGGDYSMLFFLPRDKKADPVDLLDYNKFLRISDSLQQRRVNVFIPKFKLESEFELNKMLNELGVKQAFTDDANFGKMRDEKDIFLSSVLHKSFVEVNEKGTEAAATTVAVFGIKSAMVGEVEEFIADHPFMFFIMHRPSKSILFMGKLNHP